MSKFEIELSDMDLDCVWGVIQRYEFPKMAYKKVIAITEFGSMSSWNVRKVREAVSRLQAKGFPIIAHHGGYSVFGDDPQPVIEYLNREYHRVYESTKKNDQIFAAFKQKYGNSVSEKVQQMPGQPMMTFKDVTSIEKHGQAYSEPAFRKSYSPDGTLHNL